MRSKTKLVFGVGVNDADYSVEKIVDGNRVLCFVYRTWVHMLERCYSKKSLEKRPTYVGCTVCNEWLRFSVFREWMLTQAHRSADGKIFCLDKDLIGTGKLYSPETCCFITSQLNTFFNDSGTIRGEYLIGVSWDKARKKFTAKINVNGVTDNIGRFKTEIEAHEAWVFKKLELAEEYASKQTDMRIANGIRRKANQMRATA